VTLHLRALKQFAWVRVGTDLTGAYRYVRHNKSPPETSSTVRNGRTIETVYTPNTESAQNR